MATHVFLDLNGRELDAPEACVEEAAGESPEALQREVPDGRGPQSYGLEWNYESSVARSGRSESGMRSYAPGLSSGRGSRPMIVISRRPGP